VGFPSYHTLQALVLMWYARSLPMLRWPAIVLNIIVLAAIPIQGGHHLVDAFGGTCVTLLAIWLAARVVSAAERHAAAQNADAAETLPATPQSALAH
jgi:membrane-associated phospholipid phosphatase